MLSASPGTLDLTVPLARIREHPQGVIDRFRGRKNLREIAVQNHHIGTLREPRQVLATNAARKSVLRPHFVRINFFHSLLVRGGSPAVH